MTRALDEEELKALSFLLKGDRWALKLALDLVWVGHLWDDLIDGDVERSADEVHRAFVKAFWEIPNNPLWQRLSERQRHQLEGLLISAALQYRDSTKLEMGDEGDRFLAFLTRNAIMAVLHFLMALVGGDGWLEEHGVELWRLFRLKDKYLEFVEEGRR